MYRQSFFKSSQGRLLQVLPVRAYLRQMEGSVRHPFKPRRLLGSIYVLLLRFRLGLVALAEKALGTPVFVLDEWEEMAAIDPSVRKLLVRLLKAKFLTAWKISPLAPDVPPVIQCVTDLGPIHTPSGKFVALQFYGTGGVGENVNDALIRSIAEAFERYSLCVWDEKDILRGSFAELKERGAVDPRLFRIHSEQQLSQAGLKRRRTPAEDARLGWVRARDLDGAARLIPAQLCYIPYARERTDEPVFTETTTNGCAAGRSFEEAAYKAICEAIERDSFLIFWLNRMAPPQIDLDSIELPRAKERIAEIRKHNLELYVLDTTTDLGVPSFASVMIDRLGEVAVTVSCAADFDVDATLEKLILETLKFLHIPVDPKERMSVEAKYPNLDHINDRRILWSAQKMIPYIGFFLTGKEKRTLSQVRERAASAGKSIAERLSSIQKTLREKRYHCYLVDVTAPLARKEGLCVVRAVIPELVPIYFRQEEPPLGVERLYHAPVSLGYRETPSTEVSLNPIPHPFA